LEHISFSAFKDWAVCPFRFKLLWVDRVQPYVGNEFTAFGSAIHKILEYQIQNKKIENFTTWEDFFDQCFIESIKECYTKGANKFDKEFVNQLRDQGKNIVPFVLPFLKQEFGDFELMGTEVPLYESIQEFSDRDFKFKGFIDLIIKTKDNKIHVLDYKTATWGWDAQKKSDKMILYQLIFYKHFVAQKWKIDPSDIEVHFLLIKRTTKKNHIEIVNITSGKIRTKNALAMLKMALTTCNNNFYPKKRTSCTNCQFYKTKFCP
jgi:hypothetical protein